MANYSKSLRHWRRLRIPITATSARYQDGNRTLRRIRIRVRDLLEVAVPIEIGCGS
jgi:hypothetical protein